MTTANLGLEIITLSSDRSPEALFKCIADMTFPVWLDSSGGENGRFHILSALPESHVLVTEKSQIGPQDFVDEAQAILDANPRGNAVPGIPFVGGLIGYVGYDFADDSAQPDNKSGIPDIPPNPPIIPEAYFGLYLWAVVVDNEERKTTLIFHPSCEPETKRVVVERFKSKENEADHRNESINSSPFELTSAFQATITQKEYKEDLKTINDFILDGDVYQVNYSQHFQSTYSGDPLEGYLALRQFAPAPYSGFLEIHGKAILCHSPEQFIEINDRQVRTRPIKGTAPRATDSIADGVLAQQLRSSEKDQAENLMIVDLMRNDLGRHCEPGSIEVSKLFELESYSNVHHLVSEVVGTLNESSSPLDMLASASPGGSITGAPKKRAMEIIHDLEHQPRSFYCGSLGYLSLCGHMDTNIGIRSLVADGERLHCWGGGGIVADSDPDGEYHETLNKVGGLLDQLERLFLNEKP